MKSKCSVPVYNSVVMLNSTIGQLSEGAVFSYSETKLTFAVISKIKNSNSKYVGKYVSLYDIQTKCKKNSDDKHNSSEATTGKNNRPNNKKDDKDDKKDDDSSDDTKESEDLTISEPVKLDKEFFKDYSSYINEKSYKNQLKNGLNIRDLRGILGMPHQFTAITDPRIDSTSNEDSFGRVYSEKIIKNLPLLLMTPGRPSFMADFDKDQKKSALSNLISSDSSDFDILFKNGSGKYYSLVYDYTSYFHYVNAMLRSAAYFLDIQDETIDGKTPLGEFNWLYSNAGSIDGKGPLGYIDSKEIYNHGKLSNFLGPYAGCIAFYADAGNTVDESFSNSTTESQLASTLNTLSDTGREINFLIGNVGTQVLALTDLGGAGELGSTVNGISDAIDGLLGEGNILSNILDRASNVLGGGRLVFPELWSDSSFSRSYSCSMKLVSPSGDKLSVFLNILVPIYHLLGFTLPRQAKGQAYFSPFLVRAYYKSLFNVDMGIVTGLSITKGSEGEWTSAGLPTVANVSFEIKDLYDDMFMSPQNNEGDKEGILSNIQELDYIANSCGVNINDQEIGRTLEMYVALGFSTKISDKISIDIFGNISQYFNQKMNDLFGMF